MCTIKDYKNEQWFIDRRKYVVYKVDGEECLCRYCDFNKYNGITIQNKRHALCLHSQQSKLGHIYVDKIRYNCQRHDESL